MEEGKLGKDSEHTGKEKDALFWKCLSCNSAHTCRHGVLVSQCNMPCHVIEKTQIKNSFWK